LDRAPSAVVSAIVERLAELAKLGRHANGIDRALATPQERAAREKFAEWARAAGYTLTQDRVGNLFARRRGSRDDARPILVGSHLDTVPTGGAYDGAYGVVAALCALETLDERHVATQHPIEAVAWAGEEGTRFPLGCLGSSVFCGAFTADHALSLKDGDGIRLQDALASSDCGLLENVPFREDKPIAAYLELHVEQGPVLEREGFSLGIVTAIAGQRRYRVTVDGISGHAGTVPMAQRHDALCAAAEMILAVEESARGKGDVVATVGRIVSEPNGPNVIPERTIFSVDIRSPEDARIDAVEEVLHHSAIVVRSERSVEVSVERLEMRPPMPMDPKMRGAIQRAIASVGEGAIDVPSGAGHDAMCLARIAPTAMIFVPSVGGRSHVAEEETSPRDLEIGAEALAASITEVDQGPGVL
jgi:N-carbamoyl-L-amino-acid hydrolase